MKIVNIFSQKEYRMYFIFILINYVTFFQISDYMPDNLAVILYRIIFTFLVLYNIFCIFIQSSFESKYCQILQIKLKIINPFFASFLGLLSTAITMLFHMIIIYLYYDYKLKCPFLLHNFDLNIHSQKRCELYNINSTSIFPYQYICTFNAESSDSGRNCSKVEKIIKNNEIINDFLNEYYKEINLYYCDLKEQPWKFKEVDPNICDEGAGNYMIFLFINYYFSIRCFYAIFYYLRHIKPNIENYVEHSHLL